MTACLDAPPPVYGYERVPNSAEVFRVFCRRAARNAYPTDASGDHFYPLCDGKLDVEDEPDETLKTLIRNRERIVASLEQTLGERTIDSDPENRTFDEGELRKFLGALVPLYGNSRDTLPALIPYTTRNIAALLGRLSDPSDPRASAVMDTVARVSARNGYRSSQLVLGATRSLLSYPGLDRLADLLLGVVKEGGAAHDAWVDVLNASALELADEAVKSPDPDNTTLHIALALLLKTDPAFAGETGALPVLQRDLNGNALPLQPREVLPTPFAIGDRPDDAERDAHGLATENGQPLYQTFDANQTVLSAVMHETSRLIDRAGDDRSGLESFAHGLKPLLGPWGARNIKIGKASYDFQGPDLDNSPLMEFTHALAQLARYPETDALLDVVEQLMISNESEATATVYGGLRINEIAKGYDNAKLNGPHEFWDDLIAAGNRALQRPGMLEAVIRSFVDEKAASQGKLFATWMRYRDVVTYRNAPIVINPPGPYTDAQKADINAPVTHSYADLVDRGAADTGMNRSIWQRTMSLINGLNGVRVCSKNNAILRVPTALGEFVFPAETGAPLTGMGYAECGLIEINDAVEIYMLSMLGKGKVQIKDDFASALDGLGQALGVVGSVPDVQEKESQLTGFRDTLTSQSMARFLFAPSNKFISDLFDPLKHKDGVAIKDYEPYALFPMEVTDPNANGESFLSAGVPLVRAFDDHELRDAAGKLPDGYMFGNLLSVLHKHWPSKQDGACDMIGDGNEGCVQSSDPMAPFYAPGTNLVSYEEILAKALDDEDYVGILHRAAVKLASVKSGDKDGITVLSDFVTRMLTPDPALQTRSGKTYSKTNLCKEISGPACQDDVGRIIPQLTPLYLVLDALKLFDQTWDADSVRADAWHDGRSKLVDLLLGVDRSGTEGSYKYALSDRQAYGIFVNTIPWVRDRIRAHREAGDLEAWSAGLSGRVATILRHPLSAGVVDLLDKFWPEEEASGEFIKVTASLTNEHENPSGYRGLLVSAADLLTLVDRDQNLSPAIQFASLGLSQNAFEAVDGQEPPDATGGAVYAALEFTRGVMDELKKITADGEPTAFSKLLGNVVLCDGNSRSPAEVMFDATADVNRTYPDLPNEQSLSAEEDRKVFDDVRLFLADDAPGSRSLERLYQVIQNREIR